MTTPHTITLNADAAPLLRKAADELRNRAIRADRGYLGERGHAEATLPPLARFLDPEDETTWQDFIEAPEVQEIADRLIAARLPHLAELNVTYLWKRKGGTSGGQAVLGKAVKPAGLIKHFGQTDAVIWIAYDHAVSFGFTNLQLEALTYHELLHLVVSENGDVKTVGHDFEGFTSEIHHYGQWRPSDLDGMAAAFAESLHG